MWERTVPELDRLRLLKEPDLGVLASYCLAWDQLLQAVNAYQEQGFTTTNRRSGTVKINPAAATARAAIKDLLSLARELGCTPSAEANLSGLPSADDSDDEDNPFSGNYRRD
jgi:P27 family predicted phage terminase small subunit